MPSAMLPDHVPNEPQDVSTLPNGFAAEARSHGRIYNQARLVAKLRARGSGDQLHGLQRIGRNLRGEDLVLLIADGLSVKHVTHLRVISQRMEEAVGVRGDTAAAGGNRLAQLRTRIGDRQFQEGAPVHVLVGGWIGFHQGPRCGHVERGGRCAEGPA